jgi:hypothetical protein
MLKYKNLNNISEKLENDIPPMKGEIVFQMLNGHKNNDMDRDEREKNPMLFGKTQLQTFLRIKDPYTNKIVPIGVPNDVDGDNVTSFRPFLAGADTDVFRGKFSLREGNIQDEEFYKIFWLSPERQGSPCKDEKIRPVYKIVNHKEETQKSISKVEVLKKALTDLGNLQEADIREFAASQNWSETDLDSLTFKINEFARSFPDKYNTIRDNPDTKLRSVIKKALDAKILDYDPMSGKVTMGESDITTVSKEAKADYLGAITTWVNTARNGKQVYEGILKQLG